MWEGQTEEHSAKAPVIFDTLVTAEIVLSDTFFLHQQNLALLIIVYTFLPIPILVILLPSSSSEHNF